jgi:hypothetical protein
MNFTQLAGLLKYEKLIEKLAAVWKGLHGAAVGGSLEVPEIIADIGKEQWRFEAHKAWRLK